MMFYERRNLEGKLVGLAYEDYEKYYGYNWEAKKFVPLDAPIDIDSGDWEDVDGEKLLNDLKEAGVLNDESR